MLGIYCYFDKKTNEVVYIGKDSNIEKKVRYYAHLKPSAYERQPINRILQNNPNRYTYQVLVWNVKDQDTLNALEIQYIRQLNPKFNFTNGGDGATGLKLSEESRRKISESRIGEKNPFYGRKHSEETKQKIREANLGKKLSKEARRKISLSKQGEKHPQYGKPLSKEVKEKISKAKKGVPRPKSVVEKNMLFNNRTGFARVGKCHKKDSAKGYHFKYNYHLEDGKLKAITSVDIFKLKQKIEAKGLEWRIIDLDNAINTIRTEMEVIR